MSRKVNEVVEQCFIGQETKLRIGIDIPMPELIMIGCSPIKEPDMSTTPYKLDEIMPDPNSCNQIGEELWGKDNWEELWKSARGELIGFARSLIRQGASITGQQILMAVDAGDLRLRKRKEVEAKEKQRDQ